MEQIRFSPAELATVQFLQKSTPYHQEIDPSWLARYETRSDSIFRYYSIENEVQFINKVHGIPVEEQVYYLEENVKRFLGEFVGKVPYTTVPYTLKPNGLHYAGMHMIDSYENTADLGGERENAELEGFRKIEKVFKEDYWSEQPTGVWISPPKIADYGFVFVLVPQKNREVKEYVLRYEEKKGELIKSRSIAEKIDPYASMDFQRAEDFIRSPFFIRGDNHQTTIQVLCSILGIEKDGIDHAVLFEQETENLLSAWIHAYSSSVLALNLMPDNTPAYFDKLQQTKAILLSIYSYAQRIQDEIKNHQKTPFHSQPSPFTSDQMNFAFAHIQQHTPNITEGGSCPAIKQNNALFGDSIQKFLTNTDFLDAALNKTPLERKIMEEKSQYFECPKCHQPIPAGEGITTCPHCGITKDQYAKESQAHACV